MTEEIIAAYVFLLIVNSYFQCSVQSYQQMGGGHYGKGPIALPETSLCKFIDNDTVVYPSFSRASNIPKKCPIKKVTMSLVNALQALGDSIIKQCVSSPALQRNQSFQNESRNFAETSADSSKTRGLKIKLKHVYQLHFCKLAICLLCCPLFMYGGRDSLFGTATRYGLHGRGIEFRWRRGFT